MLAATLHRPFHQPQAGSRPLSQTSRSMALVQWMADRFLATDGT